METPPPPPPPPPPPLPPTTVSTSSSSQNDQESINPEYVQKILKASTTLESMRSQLSEHEASIHFASTLLTHPTGLPYSVHDGTASGSTTTGGNGVNTPNNTDTKLEDEMKKIHSFIPPSVKDAWFALLRNSSLNNTSSSNAHNETTIDDILSASTALAAANSSNGDPHTFMVQTRNVDNPDLEYPLPKGQLSKATKIHALSTSLQRASEIASKLKELNGNATTSTTAATATNGSNEVRTQIELIQTIQSEYHSKQNNNQSSSSTNPKWIMHAYQKRIRELREYHARHDSNTSAINTNTNLVNYRLDEMTMLNERERYNPTTGITSKSSQNNVSTTKSIQNMIQQQEKRKKRRIANPAADGYDLYSIMNESLQKVKNGDVFSIEEVMGKYLDLVMIHERIIAVPTLNEMFVTAMNGDVKKSNKKDVGDDDDDDNNNNEDSSPELVKNANMTSSTKQNHRRHENISYPDFCSLLQRGLATSIPEKKKLSSTQGTRKKYIRLLVSLQSYLISYISKVSPLLDIEKEVIIPSMNQFDDEWRKMGGVDGWEYKASECTMVDQDSTSISTGEENQDKKESQKGIDLKQFKDVQALLDNVSADDLKSELSRLGMKCGGAPLDRAKRLWFTRDKSLDELPAKLFVKGKKKNQIQKKKNDLGGQKNDNQMEVIVEEEEVVNPTNSSSAVIVGSGNQRRVDIARLEVVVTALLDQLRPTLDATARRAERRLTQTSNEKEREMEEEMNGAFNSNEDEGDLTKLSKKDGGGDDDETDSEDEDAPIYNPKGVPLGWDGKPIPYWLYKLHGLNHFYTCEICGNVSYRGRHNFEKHFAEAKHSYGMKCLGIPNTKHFHGVTKIADAQDLWAKLENTMNKDMFDGAKEEEYEDSHGNVLTRSRFEDLARQGLFLQVLTKMPNNYMTILQHMPLETNKIQAATIVQEHEGVDNDIYSQIIIPTKHSALIQFLATSMNDKAIPQMNDFLEQYEEAERKARRALGRGPRVPSSLILPKWISSNNNDNTKNKNNNNQSSIRCDSSRIQQLR